LSVAYAHLLVLCDGSAASDAAVRSASLLAMRDHAQLTVAAVAETEPPSRGCIVGTDAWNEALREAASDDLERARRVVESPAHFVVLCGSRSRALADAARELGCDAIMLARPRRSLGRLLARDLTSTLRRRADCSVLEPQ
jgi:nucleotide-binding universal stress UspA family protein